MSNIKFSDLKKTRNGGIGEIIKFIPWLQSTAPYIEKHYYKLMEMQKE